MATTGRAFRTTIAQRIQGRQYAAALIGRRSRIDLVIGYQKANRSPILKLFLSRIDDLIARVGQEARVMSKHPPWPGHRL